MAETTGPSWSDIPLDLAGRILRRLPAHVDRLRFAAVCPQWCSAARQGPLPPPMPMLLLPDSTVYSFPGSKPFHFPGCAGYTAACGTGNRLVFSGEDSCFVRDPFSNDTVIVPALSRIRDVDKAGHEWMQIWEGNLLDASRIMFCSPHLIAAIFRFRSEDASRIAVCQPGASSWWSMLFNPIVFVDIVFHQGKLYALDCKDALFTLDISVEHSSGDPWVSRIQHVIDGLFACRHIFLPEVLILRVAYLVESRGAFLLVCREIDIQLKAGNGDRMEPEGNRFEVYEADFRQSQWTKVTTLGGDQVLFLCRRFCRSVNISHNEMPGDRIFFMDYDEVYYSSYSKEASSSCSVYDMRDSKISTPLPMVSWKPCAAFATWLLP